MKQLSPFSPFRWVFVLATISIGWSDAKAAIIIQSFSAAKNDRFANDSSFIGSGYDFSGVGRDAAGHWAVMLSSTVFLSAKHHQPVGSLIFYGGNDPAATPNTVQIDQGQQIGNTDLYIGRLKSPVSTAIKTYSFVTIPPGRVGTSLMRASVFMSGISPTTTGYGSGTPDVTDQAVGRNSIEDFSYALTVGASVGDVVVTKQNLSGDAGLTSAEAQLAGGDSGSPLFAISSGNLVVTGIAWAVGSVTTSGESRDASFFTYTGSYANDIQSYINVAAVPEPATLLLVSVSGMLLCVRRRY